MSHTLEYVRRRDRTWRDVWALTRQIVRRVVVVTVLTLTAAVAGLMMWRSGRHVEPGNAAWYWNVLYSGHGSEVKREGGNVVFVWWGRDTHMYMRISEKDAQLGEDVAAQKYVWTLIRYLGAGGEPGNAKYAAELTALTGQDFKLDTTEWRAWAAAHVTDVKGGDERFARLQQSRSEAARAEAAKSGLPADPSRYDPRDPLAVQARWKQTYRDEMESSWWTSGHVAEVAVLVAYAVAMFLLIRRFVRTPVARDWWPGLRG